MAKRKTSRPRTAKRAPASDRVRLEWLRRVEAEYRSAAFTQHLVLWLIQVGASPDLIRDGLRIVNDEMVHAELSHLVYAKAGGRELPHIDRDTLALPRASKEPLEHDVVRFGVDLFCLGETVAVRLFKELRVKCRVPEARRALDRILRDEVRHRDFGWALLDWLAEHPSGKELLALTERELPKMFGRVRGAYAPWALRDEQSIPDDDRAWGLMPAGFYAKILDQTLTRDYVPRFARHRIDAARAWQKG